MHLVGEFASMQVVVVVVCPSLRPTAVAKEGRGEGGEARGGCVCLHTKQEGGGTMSVAPTPFAGILLVTHTRMAKKATFAFLILIVAQFSAQNSLCLMPV